MVDPGVSVWPVGQLGQDLSPHWPAPGQPCSALFVHPSWAGKALGGPRPVHPTHSARHGAAWTRIAHLSPNGHLLRAQRPSAAQPGSAQLSPAQSGQLWPEGVAIAQLRDSSLLLSPCGSWPARCPYALCGPRPSASGPAPALAPHAPGSSSAAGWLRAVSLLSCTSFRERTAERRAVTIRLSPHWVGA